MGIVECMALTVNCLSLRLSVSVRTLLPRPLCSARTILEVKELQEELALARRSVPGEAADAAELALMLKARFIKACSSWDPGKWSG